MGVLRETMCVASGYDDRIRSCCPVKSLKFPLSRSYLMGLKTADRQTLVFLRNHEISRMTSSSVVVCSCEELLTELNSPVSTDLYFASQVEGCLGHLQRRDETDSRLLLSFVFLCHLIQTEWCVVCAADVLWSASPHQISSFQVDFLGPVAYPGIFFGRGGGLGQEFFRGGRIQQIQLRIKGREYEDLGAVAP
jgi:hypothetical protein